MYVLPTVFIDALPFVTAGFAKIFIDGAIANGNIPKDALIAANNGLVVGVVNGGVYKPYPV